MVNWNSWKPLSWGDAPRYRILTVILTLTEAEIQERIRRFTEGEDGAP